MGRLVYCEPRNFFDIEDMVLAHLRVVAMNKLRRNEPFFLHMPRETGSRSLWIHPSTSLVFHFYGSRHPSIDRDWVERLMSEASGPNGLHLPGRPPSVLPSSGSGALPVDRRDDLI